MNFQKNHLVLHLIHALEGGSSHNIFPFKVYLVSYLIPTVFDVPCAAQLPNNSVNRAARQKQPLDIGCPMMPSNQGVGPKSSSALEPRQRPECLAAILGSGLNTGIHQPNPTSGDSLGTNEGIMGESR